MNPFSLFKHHIVKNDSPVSIFLYHGTGGNETDLLPLVEPFEKQYTIVGLRGNTLEHGMPRFFKRKAEGVFDQENLKEEVDKLPLFIETFCQHSQTKAEDIIHIGYSNGANFILAALLYYPHLIKKGALLHAMMPFRPEKTDLSSHSFFVSYGAQDPIIPPPQSQQIIHFLQTSGADVSITETNAGHHITPQEVEALHAFIKK